MCYEVDDNDTDSIGQQVYPEEALAEQHVAEKGGTKTYQPIKGQNLREFNQI